jgi:polar amino acid transport system substrate-binding protein
MIRRSDVAAAALAGCLGVLLAACGGPSSPGTGSQVAADCKPAHSFPTVTPGTLTVGVIASLPYSAVNPVTQEWQGLDAEFGTEIAARECLTLTVMPVSGADAIQSLSSGKLDLLSAGAYITPERGEVVGQTDPLYYQYTVTVSHTPVPTVQDLRGRQVGALSGAAYVGPLREALGADQVREYPSTADLLADVQNGRIDVAVTASGEAGYQIDQAGHQNLVVTRLQVDTIPGIQPVYGVNMPFDKANTRIGEALDADIAAIRAEGKVDTILDKWKQNDVLTRNGQE